MQQNFSKINPRDVAQANLGDDLGDVDEIPNQNHDLGWFSKEDWERFEGEEMGFEWAEREERTSCITANNKTENGM